MKVLFFLNSIVSAKVRGRLAKEFMDDGHEVYVVTASKIVQKIAKSLGLKNIKYSRDILMRYKPPKNLIGDLARLEQEYDFLVKKVIVGDFEHSKVPAKKARIEVYRYIRFWETYFKHHEIDVIIGGLERITNMTCQVIARNEGIPYYLIDPSIPLDHRFCLDKDLMGHQHSVDQYWKKNIDKELTPAQKKRARAFLKSERSKDLCHFVVKSRPVLSAVKLKYFFEMLYNNWFIEKNRNPYMKIGRGIWSYIVRLARYTSAKSIYKSPSDDKIVFFPFHVTNDSQILVRAQQYKDQENIIRVIADSLPIGFTLYLKEHPNLPGDIPFRTLKRLSKIENIKIIAPYIGARDIIRRSECIISINSTTGWEAIMLKKPVISLGRVHYETPGLSKKVRDLYELPGAIKECLTDYRHDEIILERYINALFECSFEGVPYLYNLYQNEMVRSSDSILGKKNISCIYDGIKIQMRLDGINIGR